MVSKLQSLVEEIEKIKERNKRVESNKAWETSITRKISIFILTYIVIVIFFLYADLPSPFINSIVPAIAFLLSTLSLSSIKNVWIKYKK